MRGLLLALGLFAQLAPAHAQAPTARDPDKRSAVVIARTAGDERVVLHVRAELDAGTWRIVELGQDPDLDARPLSELAAEQSAAAAIRVQGELGQVELWIARGAGSESGTLERLAAGGARPIERVLALRVAEVLRARVLRADAVGVASAGQGTPPGQPEARAQPRPAEPAQSAAGTQTGGDEGAARSAAQGDRHDSRPGPQSGSGSEPESGSETESESENESETESDTESEAPPRAPLRAPRLWLEVAPAVALSWGGLGPALDVWASVRLQLSHAMSFAAFGIVPLWSERLEGAEGSARVSTMILGGAFDLHTGARAWELGAGVGLAALISQMSGSAEAPLVGQEEVETAAAPIARISAHLALGSGFRLCARAVAGFSVPELSVRFVEREAARFGRPFLLATLGVELPVVGDYP